ncbi:hypothetical protein HY251_18110, partial [bacterium]|nr:hypothetical protein [bacterium]
EGKLAALRLEKTGSRLVLLDSIAVGPGPRSLVLLKTEGGERLAVATEERGCTIELYRFEADHLALDRKVPIAPELAGASILAAGALSRQGEDDLVLAVRGPQGLAVPVHVSDLSGTPRVQVVVDPMCYEISATIADLDGDGQNELILGIGQWKGYCVKVYKLEAGGPLREVFSRALGTPRGFSVSGGPRQYVLCAADRMREGDAIFQDEPGLAPDRPDAVWKLSWTTEPVLEKVLERPFEERDRWSFWLPSPFVAPWKTYPGAFLAGENGDGWQRFVFVPPPGLPPVRARASSGVGMLADLDGDGEPDLLFGGSPIRVSGLRAVTDTEKEVPAAEATEASALDVGLDLLACGQAKEAALALEAVIQRPETPPAESSRARVALAQAQALLGLHDRARKTCLALADADPRSAKEALFLASAHAEEGREIASAVADLERLRRFETLSQDEDREVERRLRRLRPLALMKECVRFDRRTAAQLPLEVKKPLFVHLSDKGVRIMGRPDAGVPGDERSASIRLPLRYDGSSFRLSMRFLVEHLGYDQGMTIGFSAPRDGEGGMDGLSAYVECRGGGNIDTFERTLAANGGWGFDVGEFEPSMPANVELTYVNADAFVHGALEYGGVSRKVDFPVGPLVSGKASLGIGLRGIHGNFASFELIEVVLSGPPGAIAIDSSGETDPAARALRAFSLEDPKRALETCEGWGEKAKDEPSRRTAAFLAALALADSGKVDEAAERINALRQKAPEETDALWARDVYGLTERERAALVRAVAAWPQDPPAAIADRARSLLSQGRAGEAAIAFLAAGDAGRGMHAFEQAHAWEACGRYEQALALLEPLARDERAATMAGFMAFELSRHKLAVEFWDRIVDMPGQLKVYRDRSRRFSRDPSK